jgi:hypothetical protein
MQDRIDMEALRFPLGPFAPRDSYDAQDLEGFIDSFEKLPTRLSSVITDLDERQLETTYRPEGWTVRQVVHHLPDSHINAYMRMRLALTEDDPEPRVYLEERWAELPDARQGPVDLSLHLLDALHKRWVHLMRALGPDDWGRRLAHPTEGPMSLETLAHFYAWHGDHHLAHVTALRERMAW